MKNKIPHFKLISLERTMCYGPCPCYVVRIHSDGTVKYTGTHFVKEEGERIWTIGKKKIKALNDAIQNYMYFSIKEREFTKDCTCMPSCNTHVLLKDGTHRKIENYYGDNKYPKKLEKFEAEIDKIIGVKKYLGKRKLFIETK